jgi:Aerotolerance regulator N-terminal
MQFVQYGMLGALAALAIPIVIHLLFRNRPKTVELGTLQFLQIVLRENARQRKLKRWLLLALRMAAVALLTLLFARPYLLATEANVTGDRLVVVLVDRSASMGLKGSATPMARAVDAARDVIAHAGPKTQVEAAVFDRTVQPLPDPKTLDRKLAPAAGVGTDYSSAFAWARDLCVRSRRPNQEIHIFTDLQRSGLGRGDAVTLPSGVNVRVVDVGRDFPKNVAVTALDVSPATPRPGGSATVTVAVFNSSPLPIAALPVRLHLESSGATRALEQTIALDGAATAQVVFELKDLPAGLWRGHVEARFEGDELAFDDRRFLALAVAPPLRVWLLDGDSARNGAEGETYFLNAALRLAPHGENYDKTPFDPKVVDASADGLPALDGAGAVALANVATLSAADATRLADFVAAGGGLLVFTGDHFGPAAAQVLARVGLGVGEVVDAQPAVDLPWRLDRWETSHPIFRPFADPEHGDLRRPAFGTITRIKPSSSARVLASFRSGTPALLETEHGKGKVLWFASACDRDWGDWPRGRLYVPLIHQMTAYVSGLADGGPIRHFSASPGSEPGVFEAGGTVRVVNADPFESDLARVGVKDLATRFGFRPPDPGTSASMDATSAPKLTTTDDRLRPDEVWPYLAAALLGVMLVENFLANRTSA